MSNYTIPIQKKIVLTCHHENRLQIQPYISSSLFYFIQNIRQQITTNISSFIPNYQCLYNNKTQPNVCTISNISYIFCIFHELNYIQQFITPISSITFKSFTQSDQNITTDLTYFFEYNNISLVSITENGSLESFKSSTRHAILPKNVSLLYFEPYHDNHQIYMSNIYKMILYILANQRYTGSCIVKLSNIISYKPVVDFLYICSNIYESVQIIKPVISEANVYYLVCTNYSFTPQKTYNAYNQLYSTIGFPINNTISSLCICNIPLYFISTIEDINTHIGINQIDYYNYILSNMNEQNEIQNNMSDIQKCIQWCKKYHLPYNTI